jgi:excisionase family DNA binding protein
MFKINETAKKLNVHHVTIRRLIQDRKIGSIKIGKVRRISQEHIDQFLKENEQPKKNQMAAKND